MIGLRQLEAFDGRRWAQAGQAWQDTTNQLATLHRELASTTDQLRSWSGDAAASAAAHLVRVEQDLDPATSVLSYVNSILENVMSAVAEVKASAEDAARQARAAGCLVTDEGVVTPAVHELLPRAQAWQETIQSALATVRRADEEAAGQLRRLVPGARDLVESLRSGAAGENRLADLAGVATALPVQAKDLLDKAAWFGPRDLSVLQRDYGHLARDPYFATSLMNLIGPRWIVAFLQPTATVYQDALDAHTAAPAWLPRYSQGLASYLATSLASATRGLNDRRTDGAAADHVSESWLREFVASGSQVELNTDVPGWWAIGRVLAAAGPEVRFTPQVITELGRGMLAWDRSSGLGALPVGERDDRFDPLVGLLHAASHDRASSLALLDARGPDGGHQTVLQYLLTRHHWNADGSDKGSALGQVLVAATSGHSRGAEMLAANAVRLYGHQLLADPRFGSECPGLRPAFARILAHHLSLLKTHPSVGPVRADLPTHREVDAVLAQVRQDPRAAHQLHEAEVEARRRAEQQAARNREGEPTGPTGPTSPAPAGQIGSWIRQAMAVVEHHGTPAGDLNASDIALIIQHESSDVPNNINLWDSNAAAGHPSIGLMQVIQPTFNEYALPGHTDIWNPVDNIIAGIRYAVATYGSIQNVPGVVAVHEGRPYVGY